MPGRPAIDPNLALVGLSQAGDDHQQRRLARARRAEQRDEFAGFDVEIGRRQRLHRAVMLGDAFRP